MADATRSKTSMERWEDAFAKLSASMTSKFDELLSRMNQLETSHATTHAPPSFVNPAATATANTAYRLKLEVPRFDGTDPEGWIFKVNQFFEYHATLEHDRLTITSFYMEGPPWRGFNGCIAVANSHRGQPSFTPSMLSFRHRHMKIPWEFCVSSHSGPPCRHTSRNSKLLLTESSVSRRRLS